MKPKKRVLVACIHYPIASGRYIARALRRMGHEVRTVGPSTGRNIWGMKLPQGTEWEATPPDLGWEPDLVITADSNFSLESPYSCPHVVFGVDNHVRDYQLGIDYNHLFLAHGNGYRIGEDNVTHLSCAYDPEWFTDDIRWQERSHQAGMIGVVYPERAALMSTLDGEFSTLTNTGLVMHDYRDAYNDIMVSVCKSVNGDMAQRIFETAAMGCLILSDECHDFEKLGFEAWKHYIPYETPQEAVQNVREVLRDWTDDAIMKLQARSIEWVEPHTWDARCRVIMDTVFNE